MTSDNLFTYNEIESGREIVATESSKKLVTTKVDSQKTNEVTITSLEIAELTGKRHDHILRDIESQLSQVYGAEGVPKFGDTYQHPQNRQIYKMYRLPKKEALLVISGYDAKIRMAIIDRLEYLENHLKSNAPKLPQTYKEALRELLNQVEQNELLQIENAKQQETIADQAEIINAYQVTDKIRRNKQELATLLNRKIRELADLEYNRQYAKCYNEIYKEFSSLHCFTHKVDMQFLRTNIDYLSECLKMVLDKIQNAKEQK